jgi:hypothetical protein
MSAVWRAQVDRDGNMFNLFTDRDNQPLRVPLGNIDDLVTFEADRVLFVPAAL